MINIDWSAEITCNDREDGNRHVTITRLAFSKQDDFAGLETDDETD